MFNLFTKTTTNQPLKDHYTVVDGMCYGSGVDVDEEDVDNSAALSVTSRYLSLFPNFIIGTYFPNQIGVYLNIPISPGITSQKRIIYTTDGKVMSDKEIKMVRIYGGVFIKKIMKCVKDFKKADILQRHMKEVSCLLFGKKEFRHFKNL
jgi:hypothetical protein